MTNEIHIIKIWGKTIKVHIALTNGKPKDWTILKDGKQLCPRCDESYPNPTHNSEYTCKKCKAIYHFAGANHPKPLEEVRDEIIEVARKDKIDLSFKCFWMGILG